MKMNWRVIFDPLSQEARDKVALAKMDILKIKAERPLADRLEEARSRVRRVITYCAIGFAVAVGGYGIVWMGDRALTMTVVTACVAWVSYWFAGRNKPPEIK